jgi:hypothetical protein
MLDVVGPYNDEGVLFESGWLPKLHTLVMGNLVDIKSLFM